MRMTACKDLSGRAPGEGITAQKFWGRSVLDSFQEEEEEEEECLCKKRIWGEEPGEQEFSEGTVRSWRTWYFICQCLVPGF